MNDETSKDKPRERITMCNSKSQPGESWPEEMFREVEAQIVELKASGDQGIHILPESVSPAASVPGEPGKSS